MIRQKNIGNTVQELLSSFVGAKVELIPSLRNLRAPARVKEVVRSKNGYGRTISIYNSVVIVQGGSNRNCIVGVSVSIAGVVYKIVMTPA